MPARFARIPILCVALAIASGALAAPPPPLTEDGLGPVRIGMTPRQVEKIVGPLDLNYEAGGPDCGEGMPKRPWIPGVGFMFVNGRLARIDISADTGAVPKSEAGVGVGSTVAQVKRAYGKRLKVEPRPYEEDDEHDLVVNDAKRRRKFIFETSHGRIETFRTGVTGPVDYIEGCA